MSKLAVILLSGMIGKSEKLKSTLFMLNLRRKFNCSVVENTKTNIGMVKKVKDYVTYGEIDDETFKLLKEKRGDKDKKFFRLHPPRKGFGRKGVKKSFKEGGALGYRGDKINELIKRMI
ncbi:uL30 family ribosomal protein [Candidatus Woesearchaeota archaeon]|nr:uL30 family ribosomal protein [Candidatus Woesearchaeota archaeon]